MSITIKLVEDQVLVIKADAEAWTKAYTKALDNNGVIEVHDANGRTLAINPHQILFWEHAPDEEEQAQARAAHPQPA